MQFKLIGLPTIHTKRWQIVFQGPDSKNLYCEGHIWSVTYFSFFGLVCVCTSGFFVAGGGGGGFYNCLKMQKKKKKDYAFPISHTKTGHRPEFANCCLSPNIKMY